MLEFLEPLLEPLLQFLFEPLVDTYFFGCPDFCIIPNGDLHQALKVLFMPLVLISIGVGSTLALLIATGRMPSLPKFSRKDPMEKMIEESQKEPKTVEELEDTIRKSKDLKDLKIDNPDEAFEKFIAQQDPEHPLKNNLDAVRTEAKEQEITTPEAQIIKNQAKELEDQAQQVKELMEKENLTEDEAVERILNESMPKFVEAEEELIDKDIFKQDETKSKYPKSKFLRRLEKHFGKKEKPKFKWKLNDLGLLRRDQYAQQIELKLEKWAFPSAKYEGKNQTFQLNDEQIKSDLKKLALFLSMGELMNDKKKKKKMYWERLKVATQ